MYSQAALKDRRKLPRDPETFFVDLPIMGAFCTPNTPQHVRVKTGARTYAVYDASAGKWLPKTVDWDYTTWEVTPLPSQLEVWNHA